MSKIIKVRKVMLILKQINQFQITMNNLLIAQILRTFMIIIPTTLITMKNLARVTFNTTMKRKQLQTPQLQKIKMHKLTTTMVNIMALKIWQMM